MTTPANENYPPGHPRHVPEAWPLLMSRDQACAYVGCSPDTLVKVCTVQPRDMGASLIRYYRLDLDAWAASLPPRLSSLQKPQPHGDDEAAQSSAPAMEQEEVAGERRESAVERARARASGGARCRRVA